MRTVFVVFFLADALLLQCRQRRQAGTISVKTRQRKKKKKKMHLCFVAGCHQRCRMDFLLNETGGNALSCSSLLSQILRKKIWSGRIQKRIRATRRLLRNACMKFLLSFQHSTFNLRMKNNQKNLHPINMFPLLTALVTFRQRKTSG